MARDVPDPPADAGPPLSLREKLSYGFGDFAFSLSWNLVGAFLLYYYTNVALLPVAGLGALFLLSRLLDAGVDLGVGVLVDRTRTRWGRTRPYFLFGALPFAVLTALTFMSPDISPAGKQVYAYVTFILLGLVYSLLSIPFSALMPMISGDNGQRLQLGSFRAFGTSLSVIIATAATMPLVGLFGRGDEKRGFAIVAVLYGAISLVLALNLFLNCRERHNDDAPRNFNVLAAVRDMLRNRAWVVTSVFAVLNFVRFGAVLSLTAFFAIEVLKKPWMIGVLLPSVSGMLILAAFLAPPILKRFGVRASCLVALALAAGLYLLLPFLEREPIAFLAVFLLASVSVSITMTAIFTMAANLVEYHQWKFGVRNEGLLSSGISLATKVGMAIGTAIVAFCLGWAGYDPKAVSGLAVETIRWSYYGWAIAVFVLQMICIAFWPMDGLHEQIRKDLEGKVSG